MTVLNTIYEHIPYDSYEPPRIDNGLTSVGREPLDDLRPCLTHRVPINRCAPCWPMFLANLGRACWMAIVEKRKAPWLFVPRASFFKPSIQEQREFAKQIGLLK